MALFNEPEVYNPLTEFLLTRAIRNYGNLGGQFYWMLRSWYYIKPYSSRIHTILEQYIMVVGSTREKILSQLKFNNRLKKLTKVVQSQSGGKGAEKAKLIVNENLEAFFEVHQSVSIKTGRFLTLELYIPSGHSNG